MTTKDASMQIIQLVHTLSYGDAISTEVLALDRVFKQQGHNSRIIALHVHPKLKGQADTLQDFPQNYAGTVILHYSLGSPLNNLYSSLNLARKFLIYHNLTPAHWFAGVNPRIVTDIEIGQKELPALCQLSDGLIADSQFNAGELAALGFKAHVLELPFDHHKWAIPENQGIFNLVRGTAAINVMHVGRLAPNKCIEDIIKSFYFLHHKIEKNSILWLVGIDTDTELYSFSLRRLVHELDLEEAVRFVGCMADEEVKAVYQTCSVYMCMSEHEGFCLPLLEAMYFGLPVIAYDSSAIAGTLGDGGVLIKEKRHAELAELVYELGNNLTLRNQIITAGKQRVKHFSIDKFSSIALDYFCSQQSQESVQGM